MLSIEQKYNICLMAEKHPKWTQSDLARWAYETFQLSKTPSQGTVSRLLSKKDVYMNSKYHERDSNRLRKQHNALVRRVLQEWVSQSIWNDMRINSHMLQTTAQMIWLNIPARFREGNGIFNYRWMMIFLSKLNLNSATLESKTLRSPRIWTFEDRCGIKQLLKDVSKDDIYTVDDTFLAYNLPLDYSQYESSSIQSRIEVMTVMLCSNLTGNDKVEPFIVGRYNNYGSFRNYFPNMPSDESSLSQLGTKMAEIFKVSYRSNRKSIITSTLFHDWLARWDKRLVANNKKIYIILDDSSSHRIINIRLKNITLIYTSASTKFLPFNWGVIEEFKTRYRIQQYEALIELQNRLKASGSNNTLISFDQSELTMSNAFKFVRRAWDDIPSKTIQASWKCAGFVPPYMFSSYNLEGVAFKRNEKLINRLDYVCRTFECVKKWDCEMLLDLNIENKYKNILNTRELIDSAIVDEFEPNYKAKAAKENSSFQTTKKNDSSILSALKAVDSANESVTSEKSFTPLEYIQLNENDLNFEHFFYQNEEFEKQLRLFNVSNLIDNPNFFERLNDELKNGQPSEKAIEGPSIFSPNTIDTINEFSQAVSNELDSQTLTSSNTLKLLDANSPKYAENRSNANESKISEDLVKSPTVYPEKSQVTKKRSSPKATNVNSLTDDKLISCLETILEHGMESDKMVLSDQTVMELRTNLDFLKLHAQKTKLAVSLDSTDPSANVDSINSMGVFPKVDTNLTDFYDMRFS